MNKSTRESEVINHAIKIATVGASIFMIGALFMFLGLLGKGAFAIGAIGWCVVVYGLLKMKDKRT